MKYKLGELITIKHGFAFKGKNISTDDNGIVLVTPGNFKIGGGFKEDKCKFFNGEYPDDYVLKPGSLIVTMTDLSKTIDTLGFSALVPTSDRIYLHNQRIGLVHSISNSIDKQYLYWFMRTPGYQRTIAATSSGSTVHHTSPDRICETEIELPGLEIQKRIAGFLDSFEEKIETNNKINDNLQQQAMALFSKLFPLAGKADAANGILSDIAVITMGQSPSGESYNEIGNGVVFFQGRAEFGFRFPSVRLFTTEPKRMASYGDTLVSVRAPVGDLNIAHEDCCVGRGLAAVHSNNGHPSFILYTMLSLRNQLDVYNGQGTVFGSINRKAMNELSVFIPSNQEMDAFERLARPIDAMIRKNHDENVRLNKLRDTLLPRLMSGEIDVSSIQL